jgi:hypothetical protein
MLIKGLYLLLFMQPAGASKWETVVSYLLTFRQQLSIAEKLITMLLKTKHLGVLILAGNGL